MHKRYVPMVGSHDSRWYAQYHGLFKKVGGGLTPHLNEAEVIGWTPASHKKWLSRGYVLVPVKITKVK